MDAARTEHTMKGITRKPSPATACSTGACEEGCKAAWSAKVNGTGMVSKRHGDGASRTPREHKLTAPDVVRVQRTVVDSDGDGRGDERGLRVNITGVETKVDGGSPKTLLRRLDSGSPKNNLHQRHHRPGRLPPLPKVDVAVEQKVEDLVRDLHNNLARAGRDSDDEILL